nr:hypothetical protein BaRGS_025038 [Batillaria attramentaria]
MGKKSKDELRDEVSQVTLELRQLQGKVEDFQKIFRELEDKRQGVRRTHFPPKYFHMKDLAREYSHVATELRTTDEQTNGKSAEQRRQSPIARLMAASEAFAGKANTVHDLEAIRHVDALCSARLVGCRLSLVLSQIAVTTLQLEWIRALIHVRVIYIINIFQIMDKAESKADLLNEVSHVTLELHQLQDRIAQLQDVFEQLENSYIILRDLLEDVSDLAQNFRDAWYGSTDTTNTNRRRGTVTRLVENCKAFASNRQALNRLEVIQNGLSGLKKKELKRELEERKADLAQKKLVFKQLGDLLQELERLHVESKRYLGQPVYDAAHHVVYVKIEFKDEGSVIDILALELQHLWCQPSETERALFTFQQVRVGIICVPNMETGQDHLFPTLMVDGLMRTMLMPKGVEQPENPMINTLLESYRAVAQREKAEKERKKYVKRRSHAGFQDKYGLTSVAMKWKIQPAVANLSIKEKENEKVPSPPQMVEPVTDFDPLPPEIFTEPVQLEKVTHLTHRLAAPEFQPAETVDLRPIHKHLLVRRSLRCRECEHNLSKPDFNPLSIKFKIQLIALNHIPELRIMSPATFTPNKETVVTFTLSNPSVYNTVVKLLPIEGETDTDYMTAKIELPKADLVLAHHDDTAVYDDSSKISPEFKDDPRVIVFRRANKLGFVAKVTPICKSGDVKVSFQMKHEFRNTAAAIQSEDKEPKLEWLQQQVFVRLGRIGQ